MYYLYLFCSIKDYIDFKTKLTESKKEPVCDVEVPEVEIDQLPGLQYRDRLDYYSPETGLRMVIMYPPVGRGFL